LIEPAPRSPIQFSDHVDCDGAKFFMAAAELELEGIVSKRVASRYRSGLSRAWLKTKNMVESEFILLGTERASDGVPWALLASDRDGRLEFAGPAILNPPQALRAAWTERMAALAVAKPPLRGLRQGSAQWLRPELRVRVRHSQGQGDAATRDRAAVHHRLSLQPKPSYVGNSVTQNGSAPFSFLYSAFRQQEQSQ
jgi:ATP-dependent DNA ligase